MLIQVLTVDDHPLMRDALRRLFDAEGGCNVRGAASLAEALSVLRRVHVDLLLLDLVLPGCQGLDALDAVRQEFPALRVAVVSAHQDPDTIHACLGSGAVGYLPKSMPQERFAQAIARLLRGGGWHPAGVADAIVPRPQALALPRLADRIEDPRELGLTDRQVDVLGLMLEGLPNKTICKRLALAEGTVKVHVSAVLRAFGARTRTQAVLKASRLGLKEGGFR